MGPVMPETPFFLHCIFKIAKPYLPVLSNGRMDLVHVLIYTLIQRLDPAGNEYLPLQLSSLVSTGEAFQFFN